MMTSMFVPVKSARFNSWRFFGFKSCARTKLANATAEIAATTHILAIGTQSSLVCLTIVFNHLFGWAKEQGSIVGSKRELVNVLSKNAPLWGLCQLLALRNMPLHLARSESCQNALGLVGAPRKMPLQSCHRHAGLRNRYGSRAGR